MAGAPKGSHNNPNGRPKKERALTDLLVKELSHTTELPDGTKISGKKLIARNIVNAITTGRIKFPKDGEESVISIKDWIDFVKWLYTHVDGQAKSEFDVTSAGEKINPYMAMEASELIELAKKIADASKE